MIKSIAAVRLSPRYFHSLLEHAVPLNEAAVTLYAHNPMAFDISIWLAHRLNSRPGLAVNDN